MEIHNRCDENNDEQSFEATSGSSESSLTRTGPSYSSDTIADSYIELEDIQSTRRDTQTRSGPESSENGAGFFSKLTFQWITSLVVLGYRRPLQLEDIPLIDPNRRADDLAKQAHYAFKANIERGDKAPLFRALYGIFKTRFWMGGACRFLADVLLIATPYTLRYLIQFAMDSYTASREGQSGPPVSHGVGYLIGIVVMLAIQSLAHNHYMFMLGVIGSQCRAILVSAIFDKSLRVLGRARLCDMQSEADSEETVKENAGKKIALRQEDRTAGHVTHLLSVETARVDKVTSALHLLWTSPVALALAIALLIVNLRVSALAGLGLLIAGFAGLIVAVGALFRQRKTIDRLTQLRLSLTQEVLSAISLVKCFGWETGISEKICNLRGQETRMLHRYLAVRNAVVAVSQALPVLTAMISFITYAMISSGLSAAVVFSSVALFTSMRMSLVYLPVCIQGSLDGWASLSRIQDYLLIEEIEDHPYRPMVHAPAVVQQATFKWDQDRGQAPQKDEKPTVVHLPTDEIPRTNFMLEDIDLTLQYGELLAVIGTVASGKTSLLSALVGDMACESGKVTWGSSYVLCPQKPWMHNATVRENITFGRPFDEFRYRNTIEACSLARDLNILNHGDGTMVGESGVVLSGGQKQRISLARALYSDAQVVLLDDPLSAVDANVGRAILDEVICGQMKKLTRVMCTHDANVLRRSDRILWMDQGRIRGLGTYEELMSQEPALASLLKQRKDDTDDLHGTSEPPKATTATNAEWTKTAAETQDDSMQDEDRNTRSVSWSVYGSLFSSRGNILLAIICAPMLVSAQACTVMTSLWLAWWSSDRFALTRNTYIAIYASLAIGQVLLLYLFGFTLGLCCTRSSQVMLNTAVKGLLKAPMSFFNTTPLGRHMNRFSADVEAMDHALPEALRMHLISLCGLAAMIALMICYFHWFGIAVAVLIVLLVVLALYYRASAREVKRHESVFRSVVFARFVEGLTGVSTLRTYSMQRLFSEVLCRAIDDMSSATITTLALQRWLSLRQDAMTIVLVIVMGILVIVDRKTQNPSITGLVLSLMLNAVQVIQVVVREWADVESAMNSTERLHTYANDLPQELDASTIQPSDWPTRGEIVFSQVRMRYRSGLPEALKGVNLQVREGEKLAIVGRTGAGKSSIVNALFRLTECSDGSISIDGLDISQIHFQDLRGTAMSIIPQDTALFSGTVRSNLDPFDVLPDTRLWAALRKAGLQNVIHLSDMIQDGGENLSLGQRQLLALARVLVRDSRIVVCDEATAALDTETDDRIQQTMRLAFQDKTLLCIAHRLRTILWYDRVCVMEMGQVAELGSPLELFRQEDGIFRQMCLRVGITEGQIITASHVQLQ